MKISQINIKNFKSIDLLEDFKIHDDKICCFIGKNGSGKSNLLLALNALKHDKDLTDENRHQKTQRDSEIEISATITIEEDDLSLLEKHELSLSNIQGFRVIAKKKVGEKPNRTFEAVGFNDKNDSRILAKLSKVKAEINKLSTDPENEDGKKSLLESLKFDEQTRPNLKASLDKAIEFLNSKAGDNEDLKKVFVELIDEIKNLLDFNIITIIEKELWPKLSIVLLDPNTYEVENVSPRTDLDDDTKHKFLFDLLSLSGKTPVDLDTKGSELDNVSEDISTTLTRNLKSVWGNHELKICVSRQADQIYFMFKSPQDRSLELTNLSEGQKWYLRFYTALAVSKLKGQKVIWLFDEPGQTLHASSQINLKEYFEDISENSQIFYTTHQPMMIPWHKLERIFLVENARDQGTKIPDRLWKDNELESPLREALALFVGEEMLTGTQHVLVEGPSDYIYLQGWLRFFQNTRDSARWDENYSITNRSFLPTDGWGSMPLYLLFLTHNSKHTISAIALPDTSSDEEKIKESIEKIGLDPLNQKVLSYETILKPKDIKIFGVEDIFEVTEFLNCVKEFYNARYPDVVLPNNFISPNKESLVKGICSYINKILAENNPDKFGKDKLSFDKPGVAFNIYKQLIHASGDIHSVKTKKRFEAILGGIDKEFKKLNKDN